MFIPNIWCMVIHINDMGNRDFADILHLEGGVMQSNKIFWICPIEVFLSQLTLSKTNKLIKIH